VDVGGSPYWGIEFNSSEALNIFDSNAGGGTNLSTSAVYRDVSAWYHIVVAVDTTQATDTNRTKLYVNGTQVTSFSVANYPFQNSNTYVNSAVSHSIGSWNPAAGLHFDGYMTEINFVDGQALTPSSFGETDALTGVWKPKAYAGTYGTNGFYLNFKDNASTSALGTDYSGRGNNWTTNNISLTAGATFDSMIDVPTPYDDGGNGRGNYAVLNPLRRGSFNPTISEANLRTTAPDGNGAYISIATMGVASGKWYFESTCLFNEGGFIYPIIGISDINDLNNAPGGVAYEAGYFSDGRRYVNGAVSSYGASWGANDVIGVAFDLDSTQRTVQFFKNGVSQGVINITTNAAITYTAKIGLQGANEAMAANFGQRPFAYTPPTGFKALNTQNLPEPTIAKGGEHFNAVLYTGNGGTQSITGVGFSPDFVWMKGRNEVNNHGAFDTVRGPSLALRPNITNAESTTNGINAFNSDGFSFGGSGFNSSGVNYVAWNWRGSDSAAVTNTAGSITSTVSANPTAGFSIVTYTGNGLTSATQTIGHGLGARPAFIITKKRSSGTDYNWSCWHQGLFDSTWGQNVGIWLNSTSGQNAAMWAGVSNFSSTVFSPADLLYNNENGAAYVNYVFSEVAGYSRFGRYTGNGSSNGPFVFCGFRPRFLLLKRSSAEGSWYIYDTVRDTFNVANKRIIPNAENAESSDINTVDFVSNGFKLRDDTFVWNESGSTYIFAAFAEHPFKNALAR
jgi:hypothetical protein